MKDTLKTEVVEAWNTNLAFESWDGSLNDERDSVRQKAKGSKKHLREIPPDIRPADKGFKALNTAENLRWLLHSKNLKAAMNLLNFQPELVNLSDFMPNGSDAQDVESDIISEANKAGLPENVINHLGKIAKDLQIHPVKTLLDGHTWDGIHRLADVLDCVPVAPEDVEKRNAIITATLIAAIAALYDGEVSMKTVMTLYSEQNDYHKTAFLRCLGDILPGAFAEGVAIADPHNKDQKRRALSHWFVELGEVDQMQRSEAGALKAFIPLSEDAWRPEYKSYQVTKKRQTVFAATVNVQTFIKDSTTASRFPVIELIGPIDIGRVNRILGWELVRGAPKLARQELLIQFWLEIRDRYHNGETYSLNPVMLETVKATNDRYIDKGNYYDSVRELLLKDDPQIVDVNGKIIVGRESHEGNGARFCAADLCRTLRIDARFNRQVGKAIAELVKDGVVEKFMSKTGKRQAIQYYRITDAVLTEKLCKRPV